MVCALLVPRPRGGEDGDHVGGDHIDPGPLGDRHQDSYPDDVFSWDLSLRQVTLKTASRMCRWPRCLQHSSQSTPWPSSSPQSQQTRPPDHSRVLEAPSDFYGLPPPFLVPPASKESWEQSSRRCRVGRKAEVGARRLCASLR